MFSKTVKIVATISAIIILILASYWGYLTFGQNKSQPNNEIKSVTSKKRVRDFSVSAWMPAWANESGFASLTKNKDLITSFSPVWFEAQADGTLKNSKPKNADEIAKFAKENDIEILPSIASFDHEILTSIFQSPDNFDRHLKQILDEVNNQNYGGIDIDYESTKLSDKAKYLEFLQKLSTELKKSQKRLTVAVLPKWGDEINYPSFKETRKVQDWSEIAKYADEIRIMTYDYVGSGAQFLGPIGPLDWQEKVIQYGITKVDSKKLSLGIHLYSYEKWVEVLDTTKDLGFSDPKLKFETDFEKAGSSEITSRSYTFEVVSGILSNFKGIKKEHQGEQIYQYSKTNNDTKILENRILVFIDPIGVQKRVDLAKKYNLKGVAFWRLGAEGELLTNLTNPQ